MTNKTKTITIRAKAFSHEGIGSYLVQVDPDGTVRVWDSVAGHYTLLHVLSASAIRRARKLAAAA